jgi:hypothetical protein
VIEPKNPERPKDQASERARGESSPPDPLADMRARISEVVEFFLYYISARIDTLKYAIKKRIFVASWIAISVLAAAGAIITAVVLLCEGICDGLSVLFGHRWAGELATGVLLLAVVFAGGFGAVNHLIQRSQRKSIAKYEARRRKERYARDAADQADNGDRSG